jgi:DNA-directed RNA polymerase specialized sigma24 family protein
MAESLNDPRLLAVLESYLSSLPPPLHGVYEQRFALGLSQQEACRILGLTRRKLRTGEERLRSGLRKALRGAGVPQDELGAPMVIFRPSAR